MQHDLTDRITNEHRTITVLAKDLEAAQKRWQKKGWYTKQITCNEPAINNEPILQVTLIKPNH